MGLSACENPDTPVMQEPTTFVLNTPPFASQNYVLTEDGEIELTCSQPNYGVGVATKYYAQVSLTEDFAKYEDLTNANGNSATILLKEAALAEAICVLQGIDSEEAYAEVAANPVTSVYVRAIASVGEVEWSEITSNVVKLDNVRYYFAVPLPGYIYLVGSPEGWSEPVESNAAKYADWKLYEADDAIGSKVYYGTFEIPAAPIFRFYSALTGWDTDSYGSQEEDNPIDFEIDGSFSTSIVKGKGSFQFPNYEGGIMHITVDMGQLKLTITTE